MNFKRIIGMFSCLMIACLLTNCDFSKEDDENDNSGSISSAKNISISDFNTTSDNLTASEIVEMINEESYFYNNEPVSCNSRDDNTLETCINNIFSTYTFSKTSDGYYEAYIPNANLSHCWIQSFDNLNATITGGSFSMSVYYNIKMSDNNGNDIDLSGKSIDEVVENNELSNSGEVYIQTHFKTSLSFIYNGETTTITNDIKALSSNALNPEEHCEITDNISTNCTNRTTTESIVKTGTQSETRNDLVILTENDLGYSDTGTYHNSGTINFSINNWEGVMTYSDEEIAPTYTVSDEGGYTLEGTYYGCSYSGKRKKLGKTSISRLNETITLQLNEQIKKQKYSMKKNK